MSAKDTSGLRAGISVRVSKVGGRSDLASPDIQEKAARDLCEREGWNVVDVWQDIDVSAFGGDTLKNRPGITDLRAKVKDGEVDVVVVYESARLGRDEAETFALWNDLPLIAGVIDGYRVGFDETDRFKAGINVLIDAEFSRKMSRRWKDAQARRLSQGKPKDGVARLGYRYDRSTKTYVPDAKTGPVLRECYLRYINGQGFQQLVNWLNETGVETTRGGVFRTSTLSRAMDSGFAAGLIVQGKGESFVPGSHETLISEIEWRAYLSHREKRKPLPVKTRHPRWWLAGIVVCSKCGAAMIVNSYRDKNSQAVCSTYRTKRTCPGTWYQRANLEGQVETWLEANLEAWAAAVPDSSGDRLVLEARQEDTQATLETLKASQGRLARLAAEGVLDTEGYLRARTEMEDERRALETTLEGISADLLGLTPALDVQARIWDWMLDGDVSASEENAVMRKVLRVVRVFDDRIEIESTLGDVAVVPKQKRKRAPQTRGPGGRFARSDRD